MTPADIALLAGASTLAGVVNAVAGGGSLISFPAAVAFGLPPLVANATNSVALTPGSLASAFAYRRDLKRERASLGVLLAPAFAGGLVGSILLLETPQSIFDAVVPFLVLFATGLLVYQNLRRKPDPSASEPDADRPKSTLLVVALQFAIGVYGGYFGAGMGIMTLAILDRIGSRDFHAMNGVKSILTGGINAVAAIAFIVAHAVDFRAAAIMAVGAILGGLAGGLVARRIKPVYVRWAVVVIGLVLGGSLLARR